MNIALQAFVECYQHLEKTNLDTLKSIYHPDIYFKDPVNQLQGIEALLSYFEHLLENIEQCRFDIKHQQADHEQAFVVWVMSFTHRSIQHPITVEGVSQVRFFEQYVIYQQDYYDLGSLVYEQVPLLGKLIKIIKKRLALPSRSPLHG